MHNETQSHEFHNPKPQQHETNLTSFISNMIGTERTSTFMGLTGNPLIDFLDFFNCTHAACSTARQEADEDDVDSMDAAIFIGKAWPLKDVGDDDCTVATEVVSQAPSPTSSWIGSSRSFQSTGR
jgi:hypothetical protein